jgi:two-component system, LuxR family, sensor kinase FixL
MPTAANFSMLLPSGARRVVGHSALAIFAIVAVAIACVRLNGEEPSLTLAALIYLVIVVLLSLNGSFIAASVVSVVAVVFLQDLATLPLFSLSIDEPLDGVALGAFLTTALVITRLVSKMRVSLERLRVSLEDLRLAEEASRQQAALLDLTHDTVLVRDTRERITFWNRGAHELYGWSAEEAMGQPTHKLLRTEFPAPLAVVEAELHRTGRWEGELVQSRRDDSRIVVASRWSLRRDADACPVATLETNNDITARKQAEDALSQAQRDLARVARVTTLGQLAASIAHEVNQPLTAIIADSNAALNWLALERPDLEKARAGLVAITKDAERAAKILTHIRGMLSSRSAQPYQPCDICSVIRETLPLIRAELTRHGIRVDTLLLTEQTLVMGDVIQLQQVLLNLLMNATEASRDVPAERRCILVSTELRGDDPPASVVVQVCDAGIGIGEADLSRLFEPFYTTKSAGLGMGLSVGKAIIERHAGRMWVSRNADHGVTFHFSIPAL